MGAAGSVPESLPFNSNEFPKYGVRLSYLKEFIEDCGGRDTLQSLTTTEVCEQFVKPKTFATQSSYCDLLQDTENPAVGTAQVFISHAWKYNFLDVADALVDHFRDESDTVIWFDLFSNNQHTAIEMDFNFWATTFQSAIKAFGRTVMVFAPWNNPIPLTRAWCLWELYCTVRVQSKFEVAMTSSATEKFIEDVVNDAVGEINRMLGTIDVKKSESYNPDDKVRIHQAVMASVGFESLNTMVFDQLREWVIETLQKFADNASTDMRKQELLLTLGSVYFAQGKYELSQPLFEKVYEVYMKEYGENKLETLRAMQSLCDSYYVQNDFSKAEEMYAKCLEINKVVYGERSSGALGVMKSLALSYNYQQKYDLAVALLLECLELDKELFGDKNEDYSNTLLFLGSAYQNQDMYAEAEECYDECLKLRIEILGPRHPDTLVTMTEVGNLYLKQNRTSQALQILTECFHIRKEVLGETNVLTMYSMNCIASALKDAGRFDECEAMYLECIKLQKLSLGAYHPEVLSTLSHLSMLYKDLNKTSKSTIIAAETLDVLTNTLGEKDPATLEAMNTLGYMYACQGQGKVQIALEMMHKCYQWRIEVLGENHPDTAHSKSILEFLYDSLN